MGLIRLLKIGVTAAFCLGALAACTPVTAKRGQTVTVVARQPINELEREPVPGTVDDAWIEPMVDTIKIPGQLDPAQTYYRLPHEALVEIRPGRFQKVEYPEE